MNVKYESLSSEIKEEILRFHDRRVNGGYSHAIEDSIRVWFDTCFDKWVGERVESNGSTKRKHARIFVELPIKVIDTLIESSPESDPDMDIVGKVVNISRGGLFFSSWKKFDISSILKVKVDLNGLNDGLTEIDALAMVVRCDPVEDGTFGIGLMFSSVYEESRQTLDLFIFNNLSSYLYRAE